MDIQFVPGQRWVSNTESELGLGIVVDTANRRVTVSFPAVGERRTYAISNAPLSRVHYTIGEKVTNSEGVSFTVSEVIEQGGYLIYQGLDDGGNSHELEEIDLESFVQFSRPQDRLFAGQVDKVKNFSLRVETLHHQYRLQKSPSYGLLGPRVQLLPHQLYIASQVAKRYAPRVLLADEVGLGKTIEAGLILHQQLITGAAQRALIVVPDSLVHQWLVEMSRRFNLQFTILDEERCQALDEAEPGNPFDTAQCVLCALSFLTDNKERLMQSMSVDWDLLIVDEAHHLTWSEGNVSDEYQCIESLAKNVAGLLLLTATPEQLGVDGHFARLRLLDPDRYYDLEKYRHEEKSYQPVNELVQKLLADNASEQLRKDASMLEDISTLLGDEVTTNFKAALLNPNHSPRKAIDDLIQTILDRHGTGRVLFRNTRDAVEGFPQRELHKHPINTSQELLDLTKPNAEQPAEDRVTSQLRIETLMGENWLKLDARVDWLVNWLLENRDEKVLVICALAKTAAFLENYLHQQHAIRSTVFHEKLDLIARDRAAAYFSDEEEGAQVLICSEIGSEGRNFQFAHHLVLFDLPLNADLLEQRIGRLDRIGQVHTVQIHVPYYKDGAQEKLLRWYDEGLNAFRQVCSIGQAVYHIYAERLQTCLISQNENANEDFENLVQETRAKTLEMQLALQQGRDRLLELNSCNPNLAAEVVEDILEVTNQLELADYMERVCDQFGVDQQYHSLHSVVLQPGDHMHEHSFPGLSEDGLTATYDRTKALVREDMQFHTWEHPMVAGSMDMILSGEFGNVSLCTVKLQALKSSTVLLECIFTIQCAAPKMLRLDNYFSKAMIRVLIDHNHNDLGSVLTSEHMDRMAERVKKNVAQSIIKHTRTQITELIEHANGIAQVEMSEIVKQATETMKSKQATELERLVSLSKVNPNIRKEEIEYLKTVTTQAEDFLQHSQLKLDAIRVAVSRR